MPDISLSQFVSGTGSAISSISGVFSSAVSSGSLIVVVHGFFKTGAGVFSTITDNVNTAGFNQRMWSTMVSDTSCMLLIHDKLNISSGAAASTYRVSLNYTGAGNPSLSWCALEYRAGTFTFGSSGSSQGTSTGPRGPVLTASSTPLLIVGGAVVNSTSLFASTVAAATAGQTWITTVDPTNANQIVNVIQSTGSSLTQQLTHSMTSSTRWLAGSVLYTGQTSAGGAATGAPHWFMLTGVQ